MRKMHALSGLPPGRSRPARPSGIYRGGFQVPTRNRSAGTELIDICGARRVARARSTSTLSDTREGVVELALQPRRTVSTQGVRACAQD